MENKSRQAQGSSAEDNKAKTNKEDRVCPEITIHLPAKDNKNATSEERQEVNEQRGSADNTLQESDNDDRRL